MGAAERPWPSKKNSSDPSRENTGAAPRATGIRVRETAGNGRILISPVPPSGPSWYAIHAPFGENDGWFSMICGSWSSRASAPSASESVAISIPPTKVGSPRVRSSGEIVHGIRNGNSGEDDARSFVSPVSISIAYTPGKPPRSDRKKMRLPSADQTGPSSPAGSPVSRLRFPERWSKSQIAGTGLPIIEPSASATFVPSGEIRTYV
jgi:hypothetical protein